MPDCKFYHIDGRTVPSREVRKNGLAGLVDSGVPYCSHRHSPCTLEHSRKVVGATRVLTCGGSLDKCPLTPEQLTEF